MIEPLNLNLRIQSIARKLPYDAVIYTESGHYVAEDEYGRSFCQDSPSACIQEAVNRLLSNGGGRIYIKRGDYYFSPNTQITVNASMNYLMIYGDGDATRLHIPQNTSSSNSWLFTVGRYSSSAKAVVEPLYGVSGLAFVNDVNTGSPVGPLVASAASGYNGANFLLYDVAVYDNPSGNSSISSIYWIWLNNLYGVNVRNFRYLGNNPNTNTSVLLFDSVTLGKVVDSFLYNAQYFKGNAIGLGTGSILVANSEIYGFNSAFNGNSTDGSSTIHVSNSIIGVMRSGTQSPSGNSTPAYNPYLLLNNGNLYVKFLVENSLINNATINANNTSGYLHAVIRNSWLYGYNSKAAGIINIPSSGFSAYLELSGNRMSVNEGISAGGPSAIFFIYQASPSKIAVTSRIHDNIIIENGGQTIQSSSISGIIQSSGFENIDFRNNLVYIQGHTNGLLATNGSNLGLYRIEDNVIDNSGASTSNGFYIIGKNSTSLTLPHIILRRNKFTGNPWSAVFYGSPTVTGGPVTLDLSNVFPSGSFNLPNPSTSTPSMPASGSAVSNSYDFPVEVYLSGGTVTNVAVTRGGVSYNVYSNSSGGSLNNIVRLNPGDSITITYSSAPSWVWLPTI